MSTTRIILTAFVDSLNSRSGSFCSGANKKESKRRKDKYLAALRQHAPTPPVIFFLEYYDTWSPTLFLANFLTEHSKAYRKDFCDGDCFLIIPNKSLQEASLKELMKSQKLKDRELRFYISCVVRCYEAIKWLPNGTGSILIALSTIGPSIYDSDIIKPGS